MELIVKSALYLVATPIGNLNEITARALFVLKNVDVILCEDTRHSGRLLKHYNIQAQLISFHKHNYKAKQKDVLAKLAKQQSIALISDAGMPLINDPGHELVGLCHQAGYKVITISGACAVINAVAASGLTESGFSFWGFVPTRQKQDFLTKTCIQGLAAVLFEVPHRIVDTCNILAQILEPDRLIFIAKELTKLHETGILVPAKDLPASIMSNNFNKGEIVLVIAKYEKSTVEICPNILDAMLQMHKHASAKSVVAWVHSLTQIPKNKLYQALIESEASK